MSALRVVLLGILGHGKTTLFNKITQANEVTQYGGDSVTKSIVIGQAIQGEFEILDTPGFEARQDKLLHAAGVVAALSYGDVNRILVVVKFERTDIMINNLKKILAPIRRYRDITTIIISFWDDLRRNSNYKNVNLESQIKIDIEEKIKNEFNIQSFLYSQIDDDPCNITKAITNIIVRSSFTKVTLKDSEIFSQFELLSLNDESELEYNEYSRKIKQKFRKISQSFIKFIKSLSLNEPDLINKLHYISLAIKQIANEEVEKFEKQYGEYMNEFYDTDGVNIRYLHHIYLKKEIRLDLDSVIQEAQKKMKESNKHCFNWIKQCPYCGLVWIKVVGCDSETTCGNRVFCDYDELSEENSLNKYEIFVSNNTVEVKNLIQLRRLSKKLKNLIQFYMFRLYFQILFRLILQIRQIRRVIIKSNKIISNYNQSNQINM